MGPRGPTLAMAAAAQVGRGEKRGGRRAAAAFLCTFVLTSSIGAAAGVQPGQ